MSANKWDGIGLRVIVAIAAIAAGVLAVRAFLDGGGYLLFLPPGAF